MWTALRKSWDVHNLLLPHPTFDVGHRDLDGLNNRRINLRWLPRGPNIQNSIRLSGRYKGINPTRGGRWNSVIKHHYKNTYLGTYSTQEEAALAYDLAAIEIYGHEAWTNFPIIQK